VNEGVITNESSAREWIYANLTSVIACGEAILWIYLYEAWQQKDSQKLHYWNQWFGASRETSEFRAETLQMGWSLTQLLRELDWGGNENLILLRAIPKITLPCAHSYACHFAGIMPEEGLHTYLYTWLENQVMASIKSIPLGQVAGQKILKAVLDSFPELLKSIFLKVKEQQSPINTFSPQLAILSSRHESQYSRLFRS
jgi:urease accessory protein